MARRKNKYRTPLIIGAIILALILSSSALAGNEWILSGYGGIVPEITGIQYTHPDPAITPQSLIGGGGITASVDPVAYYNPFPITSDPSGVSMTLGAINIADEQEYLNPVQKVIDNGDGTFTHKTVEVSIVKCTMAIEFRTIPTGLDPIKNVVFVIQLTENQFDIFTAADEVEAFIFDVYTIDAVEESAGNIQLSPSAGGIRLPMYTILTDTAPQWIVDAGYQSHVTQLKTVSFEMTVVSAVPNWEPTFYGPVISHVTSTMTVGIDVLMFGYWEQVSDEREYIPTPDDLTLFDVLMENLAVLTDIMGPMVLMVTIIAIAIVIVILVIQFGKFIPKRG